MRLLRTHLTPVLARWHTASAVTVMVMLSLLSLLLRLPFFFRGVDLTVHPRTLTSRDEAIFMLQGMEVLHGHLPYLHHWDNYPPLGWFAYAILMVLSVGSLTGLRIIGMLYVAATGYVIFRALADQGQRVAALWAACFYIVFASTLPGAQSVTYETLAALPFAGILYILLNPRPGKKQERILIALSAVCVMLLPSFIYLLPAIILLWPRGHGISMKRLKENSYAAIKAALRGLMPAAVFVFKLIAACFAGYFLFWVIYWWQGQDALFMKTLFSSPAAHMPLAEHRPGTAVSAGTWFFTKKYFVYYLHSLNWLIAFMTTCFIARAGYVLLYLRDYSLPLLWKLPLLLFFSLMILAARAIDAPSPALIKQILPILCMLMGMVFMFNWRDGRTLILVTAVIGILCSMKMVWAYYPPLIRYAAGKTIHRGFYNDHQYAVARLLNVAKLRKHDLFLCTNDEMLYLLSGTEPITYYLRQNHGESIRKIKTLAGHRGPHLRSLLRRSNSLFVVGRLDDSCLISLDGILATKYMQVSNIDGTAVYLRKDAFNRLPLLPVAPGK